MTIINNITFYTTNTIGVQLISANTGTGSTPITSVTLVSGTSSSDVSTLLDNDLIEVQLTPENGKISLNFETSEPPQYVNVDFGSNVTSVNLFDAVLGNYKIYGARLLIDSNNVFSVYNPNYNRISLIDYSENFNSTVYGYATSDINRTATTSENGKLSYKFYDYSGNYFSGFKTYSFGGGEPSVINISSYLELTKYTNGGGFASSSRKVKEQSSLANLYATQVPSINNILVEYYNPEQDLITVTTDKSSQVVIYIVTQDIAGQEQNFNYFARDSLNDSTTHRYIVAKLSGNNRIVAIPTLNSYYKDFNNQSPVSSLQSYGYSKDDYVVSRYQEGIDFGYRKAYQEIYPLGAPYGYSFDFTSRNDYGSSTENSLFVAKIADNQYIKAYKELYDRGAAYGYTYDTNSNIRSYYTGQQVPFVTKLTSTGSTEAYKSIYNRGATYGFTFDNNNTDPAYYQALENSFVSVVDGFSDTRGYKRGYSELFNAGRNVEISQGVPEGSAAWVNDTSTNPNFSLNRDLFVRHLYNSGYVKAKQETFDRGIPYGYNFRNYINTSAKSIADSSIISDYLNQGTNFINTVTSQSQASGYRDIYNYISTQYGLVYDSLNSNSLSAPLYLTYLQNIKVSALSKVSDVARIEAYKDIYSEASSRYLLSYDNSSSDVNYYASMKIPALQQAYNYGAIAAYQDIYDQGGTSEFNNLTSYGTYRKANYTLRNNDNNSTTQYYHSVAQVYTDAVRDYGSVNTFKRFFNLALPYGFTFDNNQAELAYYDSKRAEFLNVYSEGNFSEGINYVLSTALPRYGFNYTFSADADFMKTQVTPFLDFVDNKNKRDAYRYTLQSLGGNNFYNLTFSDSLNSTVIQNQIVPKLTELKDRAGAEAYNYVMSIANTRTGYTKPNLSASLDLKNQIVSMFKYVEDYKEADAYRRVHNYAKNFLNVGYTFIDSTDPRFLENQVPDLFDFLGKFGGYGAYKYVHETAGTMFGWNFIDNGNEGELKSQIVPMFEFINSSFQDIKVISEPRFEWPDKIVFDVELSRPAGVYAILVDKLTNDHIAGFSSMDAKLTHSVKFGVGTEILKKPVGIVIIPTPRNMTTV